MRTSSRAPERSPQAPPPAPGAGPRAGPASSRTVRLGAGQGEVTEGDEGRKGAGNRSSPDAQEQRHSPARFPARWSRGRAREGGAPGGGDAAGPGRRGPGGRGPGPGLGLSPRPRPVLPPAGKTLPAGGANSFITFPDTRDQGPSPFELPSKSFGRLQTF